jgi:hypothetical protein
MQMAFAHRNCGQRGYGPLIASAAHTSLSRGEVASPNVVLLPSNTSEHCSLIADRGSTACGAKHLTDLCRF